MLSPRPSEATSWHTSGEEQAEFAREIGSRLRGSVSEPGADDASSAELPLGWEPIHDGGGTYYHHAASGLSQWEPPTEAPRELTSLSIAEVGLLLESLGMAGLRSSFAENFVDEAILLRLQHIHIAVALEIAVAPRVARVRQTGAAGSRRGSRRAAPWLCAQVGREAPRVGASPFRSCVAPGASAVASQGPRGTR